MSGAGDRSRRKSIGHSRRIVAAWLSLQGKFLQSSLRQRFYSPPRREGPQETRRHAFDRSFTFQHTSGPLQAAITILDSREAKDLKNRHALPVALPLVGEPAASGTDSATDDAASPWPVGDVAGRSTEAAWGLSTSLSKSSADRTDPMTSPPHATRPACSIYPCDGGPELSHDFLENRDARLIESGWLTA